ncbi:MAG: histidinol dehydrogenase [bacterium]|nr:histidinol dehydrogenase [bacterium]
MKPEKTVQQIINAVRSRGDTALLNYTKRFDGWSPRASALEVTAKEKKAAFKQVDRSTLLALQKAARRIEQFHKKQKQQLGNLNWAFTKERISTGMRASPLERVGLYIPGGQANYPSTVLMTAIPARVAGVSELIAVTPAFRGKVNPYTLVAAQMAGIDRIFKIGGAQAIAALAHGTRTIPPVDKIVGPGNIYVATAKKLLFGQVAIDMMAGPSEVTIIADSSADPAAVASDLISQAEHDAEAVPILISPSASLIQKVREELKKQIPVQKRNPIIKKAIRQQGMMIRVKNLKEAVARANALAPEHLILMVRSPRKWLPLVKNAGAIFLGPYSPVALGDYWAGPSHVLPTSGTARFSSPLTILDFMKFSSLIQGTKPGLQKAFPKIQKLAEAEGLTAHAESVRVRIQS